MCKVEPGWLRRLAPCAPSITHDPGFESHQCLQICKYADQMAWLPYWSPREVSYCHIRGESEGSIVCKHAMRDPP